MKKLIIIVVFIFLMLPQMFAEIPKVDSLSTQSVPVIGIGLGLLYQISIHSQYKNNYFALRHYEFPGFFSEGYIKESAFLYGRTLNFNSRTKGYMAAAIGFSYNHTNLLDDRDIFQETHSIGIPIDLSITKGITPFLGYGLNTTINFNEEHLFGSAFFSLFLGDFHNREYIPPKENKSILLPVNGQVTKKNNVTVDYNWLYFLANKNKGHKLNICLLSDNLDWVIALHSCEKDYNDIYYSYNTLRSISFKARTYLNRKWRIYADGGFQYMSLHHKKYYSEDKEYSLHTTFLHLSAGSMDYIFKNVYIKTQLNMLLPIYGDEFDFNGYGMNSDTFIMNLELLTIGYNFGELFR